MQDDGIFPIFQISIHVKEVLTGGFLPPDYLKKMLPLRFEESESAEERMRCQEIKDTVGHVLYIVCNSALLSPL